MEYHKQRFLHDPDNGVYGDCYRTALACLLGLDMDEVPHFLQDNPSRDEFWADVKAWLCTRGLTVFTFPFQCELDQILSFMQQTNPDAIYLLAGKSQRGTTHQVIACNDKIIHDPHPDDTGLVGPCDEDGCFWIDVLLPLNIHGAI